MNKRDFIAQIEARGFKRLPYGRKTWSSAELKNDYTPPFPCWCVDDDGARLYNADKPFSASSEVKFPKEPNQPRDAYEN